MWYTQHFGRNVEGRRRTCSGILNKYFNNVFVNGKCPHLWKEAVIVPCPTLITEESLCCDWQMLFVSHSTLNCMTGCFKTKLYQNPTQDLERDNNLKGTDNISRL